MAATACAVAAELGTDVDLPGAVDCEFLVAVGVTDTAGLATAVVEATGLVAAGLAEAALTAGDVWPSAGAVGVA